MGVPISIQDMDITTLRPSRADSQSNATLHIHVKLAAVTAEIINSTSKHYELSSWALTYHHAEVYGPEGRFQASFFPSVHAVLAKMAPIAGDLKTHFQLFTEGLEGGMSRVAAHLHLYYHLVCSATNVTLEDIANQTRLFS